MNRQITRNLSTYSYGTFTITSYRDPNDLGRFSVPVVHDPLGNVIHLGPDHMEYLRLNHAEFRNLTHACSLLSELTSTAISLKENNDAVAHNMLVHLSENTRYEQAR